MEQPQLQDAFQEPYERKTWYRILRENFYADNLREPGADITKRIKGNEYNAKAFELGNFKTAKDQVVGLYEVDVPKKARLHRNKKTLRNLLSDVYSNDVDAALVVFKQESKWRFTYVSEIAIRDEKTGERTVKTTDPKRYTYLFGKGEKAKTAAIQFARLKPANDLFSKTITLDALQEAFNVEKLSKAFFNEYRKHYGYFTAYLTGEDENGKEVSKASAFLPSVFKNDKKAARDFIKKLLGRIVFMYFLEKKGWLGVSEDKKWGEGDENFLSHLFRDAKNKEDFYSDVLVPLFFDTLNNDRADELFKIPKNSFTSGNYHKLKIPFLNGGLFENDMPKADNIPFPEKLFSNLFTFFDQYNFTVYEDSPDEQTVAVDPEMLGHIFENLLEDNKDKGAFYTPKEIVHYMCQESLIEYLYTKLNAAATTTHQELGKAQTDMFGNNGKKGQLALTQQHTEQERVKREWIEQFIKHQEAGSISQFDKEMLTALRQVKICDPAIGSGAFPMGILMEIFHAVQTLHDLTHDTVNEVWELGTSPLLNAAKVKSDIIQNSVYGVDIEKGAVDIARLRFWLSLVVDETKPLPLPNLDYRIMQGNSLLESFEDIDLSVVPKEGSLTLDDRAFSRNDVTRLKELARSYFSMKSREEKKGIHQEINKIVYGFIRKSTAANLKKVEDEIDKITTLLAMLNRENSTIPAKQKLKQNSIKQQTKLLEGKLKEREIIKGKQDAIKTMQFTAENNFFLWHLFFDDVFEKGGFDIVIGNPPYIPLQNNQGALAKSLQSCGYETFERKGDIYSIFYERGFQLLKPNGNLVFITSNKWMRTEYGESTRKFFAENTNPVLLIDFAGQKIFESATVETNILLFTKDKNRHQTKACVIKEKALDKLSDYFSQNANSGTFSSAESWVVLSAIEKQIKEKIEKVGTSLKKWEIQINYGIKTGFNEAFIVNKAKRDEILKSCLTVEERRKTDALIRPILRGRDIKRYGYSFDEKYLIATFPSKGYNINDYPTVKKFLDGFKPKLNQTGKMLTKTEVEQIITHGKANGIVLKEKDLKTSRKKTTNKWFETQDNISYWEDFSKQKIVWGEISDKTKFSIDLNGEYLNEATTFLMVGKALLYLVRYLNSKLSEWVFSKIATTTGVGTVRWKKYTIEKLPAPILDALTEKQCEKIMLKIIDKVKGKEDSTLLERELNLLMYNYVGLTNEEIEFIESQ